MFIYVDKYYFSKKLVTKYMCLSKFIDTDLTKSFRIFSVLHFYDINITFDLCYSTP